MPLVPRNATSTLISSSARQVHAPTVADVGRRSWPPRGTTVSPSFAVSVIAMLRALVKTVRSRPFGNAVASSAVVDPASMRTEPDRGTCATAARAIRRFSSAYSVRVETSGSKLCPPTGTAPPCTRCSSPRASSPIRSLRTVSVETSRTSASAAASMRPSRRSVSTMCW